MPHLVVGGGPIYYLVKLASAYVPIIVGVQSERIEAITFTVSEILMTRLL